MGTGDGIVVALPKMMLEVSDLAANTPSTPCRLVVGCSGSKNAVCSRVRSREDWARMSIPFPNDHGTSKFRKPKVPGSAADLVGHPGSIDDANVKALLLKRERISHQSGIDGIDGLIAQRLKLRRKRIGSREEAGAGKVS